MSKWKKISLGEVALITRGASPRPIHDWMTKDDKEGIPWLKISDATYSISRFIQKTREYIKKDAEKKSVVVEKGDLIVSNSATLARLSQGNNRGPVPVKRTMIQSSELQAGTWLNLTNLLNWK